MADLLEGRNWQVGRCAAGVATRPSELAAVGADFLPAKVPGTAAGALRRAGQLDWDRIDYDELDWWFQTELPEGLAQTALLRSGGVATLSEFFVDDELIAASDSMHLPLLARVDLSAGRHVLSIRCKALGPYLRQGWPRSPWKAAIVTSLNLRHARTTFIGRMPGIVDLPAPVGPYRTLTLETLETNALLSSSVRSDLVGGRGQLEIAVALANPSSSTVAVHVAGQQHVLDLVSDGDTASGRGKISVGDVDLWWPFTHGEPRLHPVALEVDGKSIPLGAVGFRSMQVDRTDGDFRLVVNGVPVFCRGGCWTPLDSVELYSDTAALIDAVADVRRGGCNMIRLQGSHTYEQEAFFDACDRLGVLVWHDVMLANLAPSEEPELLELLEREIRDVVSPLAAHPCLAVVSGGSEIQQQAAMSGVKRERWPASVTEEFVPRLIADELPGVVFVSTTPSGGDLPFHNDSGLAHYYGVGSYRRPITDAGIAGLRFAAECLAFAQPPERQTIIEYFGGAELAGHDPRWKAGVPRHPGVGWDFEDVTAYYAAELFGRPLSEFRFEDPDYALDVARATVAHVIDRVFATWSRNASHCAGGLVLTWRDFVPGSGMGLTDAVGRPKASWYRLRRMFLTPSVVLHDDGLNGLRVEIRNEQQKAFEGSLELTAFSHGEVPATDGFCAVRVEGRSEAVIEASSLLDGFVDLNYAYRFGPPTIDVVEARLVDASGNVVSDDVFFPLGFAREREVDLGLSVTVEENVDGRVVCDVTTRRAAQFVNFEIEGYRPEDNWFHLAPGRTRRISLEAVGRESEATGYVRALNSRFENSFDISVASR